MGASGWSYWADFSGDPAEAMHALRKRVFDAGDYVGPGGKDWFKVAPDPRPRPESIDALVSQQSLEGTHSIIDIPYFEGADDVPMLWNPFTQQRDIPASGVCRCATEDELRDTYGDSRPSRELVFERRGELTRWLGRWKALCVVVYDGERPEALYFEGWSGD
jgi:hypothetical protein